MRQEILTFALSAGCIALGYVAGFRAGRRSQARDLSAATSELASTSDKLAKAVEEFPANVAGENKRK